MEIKVVRSKRRLRTVSARLNKEILFVRAPLFIPEEQLQKIISGFKIRFERKRLMDALNRDETLAASVLSLNKRFFQNKLKFNSVKYVTGQRSKFGCCNYRAKSIRISHHVSTMPRWVRDYVILHEMAHLIEPNHGKGFWEIVSRYRLAERARGFLMAVGMGVKSPELGS